MAVLAAEGAETVGVRTRAMLLAAALVAPAGAPHAEPTPRETTAALAPTDDDNSASDAPGMVQTTAAAPRRAFGAGYYRGTGLGFLGASLAMEWKSRITPQLHVFGFFDDGSRGFAVVPAVKLSVLEGPRSTPFVAGGVQYLRMWFGDVAGGGFGGYGTVGYSLRFQPGFELELGIGLHGKQTIRGSEGLVSVKQRPTFGPHWDVGLRYWF
jgi:hypothetical protein